MFHGSGRCRAQAGRGARRRQNAKETDDPERVLSECTGGRPFLSHPAGHVGSGFRIS